MDAVLIQRLIDAGAEVLTALLLLAGFLAVRKWHLAGARARLIATGIDLVYGAVSEIARRTATPIDDKAALALKKLGEWMASQGEEPPTDAEAAQARLAFDAKHGTEAKLLSAVEGLRKAAAAP